MDYIVLDIEFNGRKFASDLPMEVIEIGAVRLHADLRLADEFAAFVKPVHFPKLNSFIRKKTGIPQEKIDRADGFPKVISDFQAWLNRSESFLLVTWGGEDVKRIVLDTRMHKLDDAFWTNLRYYDLLKGYLRCKGVSNDVSVEAALADLGIPQAGSAHRAPDDAKMTAEVFRNLFRELDLERTQQYKDTFSNSRERRGVKNAVRAMKSRKLDLRWEVAVERFLAGRIDLSDPRKTAELREYFSSLIVNKQD